MASDSAINESVTEDGKNNDADTDNAVEQNVIINIYKIPSNRGGYQLCIDGFIFNKNLSRGDKVYWECIVRKRSRIANSYCSSKAITKESNGELTLIKHTDHGHAPNSEQSQVKIARGQIKLAAKQTTLKPTQNLQEQQAANGSAANGSAAIALAPSMPSKNSSRKIIGRVRRAGKLTEPKGIEEIDIPQSMQYTLAGKSFFKLILMLATRGYCCLQLWKT